MIETNPPQTPTDNPKFTTKHLIFGCATTAAVSILGTHYMSVKQLTGQSGVNPRILEHCLLDMGKFITDEGLYDKWLEYVAKIHSTD